jgi:hypothetical protein
MIALVVVSHLLLPLVMANPMLAISLFMHL